MKSLYKAASSAIKVNGTIGPGFPLERSVRQGCPLALYLFILATDVLGYLMADPRYEVEGLSLPKGGLIRDQTFVDDTALYLKGTPNNMDKAQRVLELFCQASGAKSQLAQNDCHLGEQGRENLDFGRRSRPMLAAGKDEHPLLGHPGRLPPSLRSQL